MIDVEDNTAPTRRGRPGYRREQVLSVAVQLFNDQGYDATSIADIGQRLGLTKSAIYHHFDSKEQLLELALTQALDGLEAVVTQAEQLDADPADRVQHAIRGAVDVLTDRLPYVTLLLRLRGNSAVELAALERRRRFDQRVTALIREAMAAGAVRDDIDAAVATRLIFGMINSVVEWYRPDGPVDADRLAFDILAVALGGLARPAEEEKGSP